MERVALTCIHTEVKYKPLSRVQLFETPWTVTYQVPSPLDSPGKNTGMGCHALLQGILLTQGPNACLLRLLHWQVGSLPLVPVLVSLNLGRGEQFRVSE